MADTLTAFETIKYNLGNRKALDGLTASEIKKAAGCCLFTFSKTKQNSMHGCLASICSLLEETSIWPLYATFNQKKRKMEKEVVPSSLVTRHRICRKRGGGEGGTTVLLWHMRWRVWLGNIMEMYRTANPGMTVRPRPWPLGVANSTEL